ADEEEAKKHVIAEIERLVKAGMTKHLIYEIK
ncbi:unnamed protein product, partial [marine sediment metagenome]